MADVLKQFLDFSNKFGFLKLGANTITFGPMALLLANTIKWEWLNESLVQSDTSMFLFSSSHDKVWHEDCHSSFCQSFQIVNEKLPLGLVSVLENVPSTKSEGEACINSLVPPRTNIYRCLRFIHPSESQQYFYRLQRSRNIWWRKFARDPEIFKIHEIKEDSNKEAVEIVAKLPWMEETKTVETIYAHGSLPLESYGTMFEVKDGRKRILPHVIESVCLEAPATLVYLADSFQPLQSRTLFRLHNRLAPYKTAIVVHSSEKDAGELHQLAEFLNTSLRREGLHTLFSTKNHDNKGIESKLMNHDLLGIPYTVIVNDDTLRNGIAGLRSRDTTLQEQVHISKITSYMNRLFKKM